MAKIGRNDPCYCGSGKKYKKCCESKDQQASSVVLTDGRRTDSDPTDDNNFDDYIDFVDDNESMQSDPYPIISVEEERLVRNWWETYKKMDDDVDVIRPHLDAFLKNHPHLVENLGLEHEVIFELGGSYLSQNNTSEYLRFLTDFRERFPAAYKHAAGFYDFDIIAGLISQKRSNEIPAYFNYFIEYPANNISKLYDLIGLLQATNNTDGLSAIVTQMGERLVESEEVIDGTFIFQPLSIEFLSPYIKADFTEKDIHDAIADMYKVAPYLIVEDDDLVKIWTENVQAISKPFERWPEIRNLKKHDLIKFYDEVILNYLRYIREKKNISWMSALYYANQVNRFIKEYLKKEPKPKYIFRFSKIQIKDLLDRMSGMGFFVDCTKYISLLNGIYFFAEYLHACGNLDEEETHSIQGHCNEIFEESYAMLETLYIEAACFRNFPLYG